MNIDGNDKVYYYVGFFFLFIFIVFGAFFILNLVVAVVVTNLECAVKDVKAEEEEHRRTLDIQGKTKADDNEEAVIVNTANVSDNVFRCQRPLVTPDLSGMSISNIENYLLIISAMEDNLNEYEEIMKEINKIFTDVCETNKSALQEAGITTEGEGIGLRRQASTIRSSSEVGSRSVGPEITPSKPNLSERMRKNESVRRASQNGDILSMMMDVDGSGLTASSRMNSISQLVRPTANILSDYEQNRRASTDSQAGPRSRRRSKSNM